MPVIHAGSIAMVGDGVTDMEARPPAVWVCVGVCVYVYLCACVHCRQLAAECEDVFIGIGVNVVRPAVQAGADWFVTTIDDLVIAL